MSPTWGQFGKFRLNKPALTAVLFGHIFSATIRQRSQGKGFNPLPGFRTVSRGSSRIAFFKDKEHPVSEQMNSAPGKTRMTYTELIDSSPMTPLFWLIIIGMCLAQMLDGMDFIATAFALPGIIREYKINPALAGGISSIGNIGLALGAIFLPFVSDRVGRKPVFQWVLLTYALGSFLSAIAPNYHFMLWARFITGVGLGAEIPIVFAVLAEYCPIRLRHIVLPLAPIFFAIGWIVAALLSIWLIPVHGWRAIYWVGIVPAVLIVFIRRYVPESLRFLLIKGRTEEARRIAESIARQAGRTDIELVPPVIAQSQVKPSFAQQMRLLGPMWAATLVQVIFYFSSFIQTFGVNFWLPTIFVRQGFRLTSSFSYTLMIFIMTPFSHVIAMWLMPKMSRTWALFLMTTAGTVFFILFGLSFEYKWPIYVLVGFQVIQTLSAQGVVSILYTLSSELFPTPVRSLGLGIVSGVGRFGAVLGPFLMGMAFYWGLKISQAIYLFAAPLFIAGVLALLVIRTETRKRALEDISSGGDQGSTVVAGH